MKEKLDEKLDVCVLMGGTSSEREVSLKSGGNVYEALRDGSDVFTPTRGEFGDEGEILELVLGHDLVFNCLHGGIGEDGTIQVLLDLLEVPYTGTGPLGSSTAMNKLHSKKAFRRASVDTPGHIEVADLGIDELSERIVEDLGFPVVIKPSKEGSSRGIKVVDRVEELAEKVDVVRNDYKDIFVEEYIDGREVTAGILEEEEGLNALPLVEMVVKRERFYNYKAKYTPGETEFICPARISDDLAAEVKNQAKRAHEEFGCSGYSRVDFILDSDGRIYGLEVNTLPGMTETSDLPIAARETGIDFPELVEKMALSGIR